MKHKFKILIVFVLVLVLVLSSFLTSYAVMPLVVGSIALTNAQAFGIALASMGVMGTALNFGQLTGEVMASPFVLGIEFNRWRQGYYEKNGDYVNTVSIPKEDLDKIYNAFLQVMGGYGNSSNGLGERFVNSNLLNSANSVALGIYLNPPSDVSHYRYKFMYVNSNGKAEVFFYNDFTTSYLSSLNRYSIVVRNGHIYDIDSSGQITRIYHIVNDSFSRYSRIAVINHDVDFGSNGKYFVNGFSISQETWNPQFNNPQSINYDNWEPQVNNYYTINLPTTIEDGERVLDLDRLYTSTPDELRNSERVTEIENAPPIEVPDPYAPVPPVTNPIPDSIANIGTDTWLDRLWSKFVDLWVLPDSYFIDNFTRLQSQIPMLAFPNQIINDLKNIANLQGGTLEDITITAWGGTHTIVNFQGLRDMLPTFHQWVRGIMFIMLLLYNYNQVYKLIRGNSYGFSNTFRPNESSNIEKGGKA